MNEFNNPNDITYNEIGSQDIKTRNNTLVRQTVIKSYLLMTLVTMISGISAWLSYSSGYFETIAKSGTWWVFCVVELAVVFICSCAAVKKHTILAAIMLLIYSIVNGVTLASIFYTYNLSSILILFFITAGMFASLAVYGAFTKRDLSAIGMIGLMGLVGVILLTVLNIFFIKSSGLDLGLCVVGLALFIGITVYDAQMIKESAYRTSDKSSSNSLAIGAALTLYLDFINIFLRLLELFGDN
ncbi:MAG: Bax inhibitor-1/YccA family protein [bacterium]|nr:Bax inhibitor-1/YccA family protein [bacterium]